MLKDILWIESFDIYAMIKTTAGKYLLSHSLKAVEEKFPSSHFILLLRSFLINMDKIDAIEQSSLFILNNQIPIGKTFGEELMKRLSFL